MIMKRLSSFKHRFVAGAGLALVAASLCALSLTGASAEDKTPKEAKPEKKTEKKTEKKKLSGQELYAIHCNRCHPERYATERTASEWKTLMVHMRVRANLPADQAKTILKYLQEDAGKP
jgi:hypothetical protein